MKKLCSLALFACAIMCTAGCGGPDGGAVTQDAEQSAIEAYQALEAQEQQSMESTMSTDDTE